MTKHLILDFETMGKVANDCAVIDMSTFVFDTNKMLSDKPYGLQDIDNITKFKLSVKDQVYNYQYVVYKDTIEFWEQQSSEVRQKIQPLKTDLKLSEFVDLFLKYLENHKIDYWWSRSNTFDPIILWRIFKSENKNNLLDQHLKYWKVRDIRTFIDAKLDFPKENGFPPLADVNKWNNSFKQHDSSWDVLADVLRFQAIIRAENDLEQV